MKECIIYSKQNDLDLICKVCNHYCKISNNKFGRCFVRKNINGNLFSLVYGKLMGVGVDPIEKKPLYHFMPGEKVFSFGTAGCNFSCKFCQNFHMVEKGKELLSKNDVFLGKDWQPNDVINFCLENKIKIIAGTYNEPTIFIEYLSDLFDLAKKYSIKTVLVSNGYMSKEFWQIMKDKVDGINIDLKSFDNNFYKKILGSNLLPVLKNIEYIVNDTKIWLEITTLIIPGYNDTKSELEKIINFIVGINNNIPWHISGFFPTYELNNLQKTSNEKLCFAYDLGKKLGLNNVYIGNANIYGKSNSYCSLCNELIIQRNGYCIVNNLKDGKCEKCGNIFKGVL